MIRTPILKLARPVANGAAVIVLAAMSFAPAARAADGQLTQVAPDATIVASEEGYAEVREGIVRLALAAVLGSILALRPRHKGQTRRNPLVVQTQIMLAIVGAAIMLIVGQSLARAFGIVGAANLIRYRSTIDDPKEAVVMLCALAVGLAAGVGLYKLAPSAALFMALVLWIVEYFEPTARKKFELTVSAPNTAALRPKVEGVLSGFQLDFELISESDDELGYSVSTPITIRTRDVSDTIRLVSGAEGAAIEWDEKKNKN